MTMKSASFFSSRANRRIASAILASALGLSACTGGTSTESLVASAIGIISGTGQTAVAGAVLAQPFIVEVLDQNADGMLGASVNWTIVTGGGSVTNTASFTDSAGQATTRYTAGPVAGPATIRASVNGIPNPVIFTVTITSGTASRREE
jgi:hypothetical protein